MKKYFWLCALVLSVSHLYAQKEYLAKINPATGTYSTVDSITGVVSIAAQASAAERHDVLVVRGAAGDEAHGARFAEWTAAWKAAAERAGAGFQVIGDTAADGGDDKTLLQRRLTDLGAASTTPLWLVLIGHGTWDGRSAKFNLRGPDVSAEELATWLDANKRPLVLIDSAPASAPFLQTLARPGRVVMCATKSGSESNATRFGGFIAEALGRAEADLDRDGQVSALELFLSAATAVEASYKADGLLATEHALLDDNGDGRGVRADWFQGIRAVKTAAEGLTADGLRAHQLHLVPSAAERALSAEQRSERDRLEVELADLRAKRQQLGEAAYYEQAEALLVRLARIYAIKPSTP